MLNVHFLFFPENFKLLSTKICKLDNWEFMAHQEVLGLRIPAVDRPYI
jgi:hypothetical protein